MASTVRSGRRMLVGPFRGRLGWRGTAGTATSGPQTSPGRVRSARAARVAPTARRGVPIAAVRRTIAGGYLAVATARYSRGTVTTRVRSSHEGQTRRPDHPG